MSLLIAEHLTKDYKRKAATQGFWKGMLRPEYEVIRGIDAFSFEAAEGEKIGFLGKNGAGKSTFVKLATGILKPSKGSIELFGLDPFEKRKHCSNNYGVIFGNRKLLWPHVPVIESLKLAGKIYGIHNTDFEERVSFFDSILGINDLLHVAPRKLSFGQRMRCQMAFSLIHLPKVIFLDEATIGLDITVRKQVIDLLNTLVEREKMTLFITSHLIEDVDRLADRLVLLDEGKKIFDGDKSEFRKMVRDEKVLKIPRKEQEKVNLLSFRKQMTDDRERYSLVTPTSNLKSAVEEVLEAGITDFEVIDTPLESLLRDLYEGDVRV